MLQTPLERALGRYAAHENVINSQALDNILRWAFVYTSDRHSPLHYLYVRVVQYATYWDMVAPWLSR